MLTRPNNAPVKIHAGTFTVSSTGSLAITGTGFKPKSVIIHWLPSDSGTVSGGGVGATDGTNQFSTSFGAAAASAARDSNSLGVINVVSSAGTMAVSSSITSFDNNGFTINTGTWSSAQTFGYIAIG